MIGSTLKDLLLLEWILLSHLWKYWLNRSLSVSTYRRSGEEIIGIFLVFLEQIIVSVGSLISSIGGDIWLSWSHLHLFINNLTLGLRLHVGLVMDLVLYVSNTACCLAVFLVHNSIKFLNFVVSEWTGLSLFFLNILWKMYSIYLKLSTIIYSKISFNYNSRFS
jgi:hypothetical protein